MTSYLQIAGDPTKWWPDQPFSASQLTGQPVSVQIVSPVYGYLVISPRAAGVAVFELDQAPPGILDIQAAGIYVPSAAGLAVGHAGYQLPVAADLGNLAGQIAASMQNSGSQAVALGGTASGGTLVLNGATLPFAVVFQPAPIPRNGGTPPPVIVGAEPPPPEVGGVVPHH
jgi:hypothetical protein